ncbi:hypothetical protein [Leifsonia virtsii]|uniref:ABC transporter ATP-binding protein n=1 Tax=Leifsonia virtsii TaxID=3035915 RepID=A0ABT8IVU6_9MICO|nr:hypothetical protein [Leifsonia virtsii]MDN4596936.1 hypothetical protein [Leifsonia virtsii]
MKIVLDHVGKGAALPETSAAFETGRATLARAETEQRPTVLGLIASGRMRPDTGSVTIDGATDYSAMRRRIALIDAPDVSEPAADVTVSGIVAEELMFAGRPSHPVAVGRTLRELGASEWSRAAIGTVPPTVRIRLLAELALLRKGVDALVIVSPDRHGGDPVEWWRFARELAGRDKAVLVVAGDASAAAIAAASLVSRMDETGPGETGPDGTRPDTFDEDPGRDDTDDLPDQIVETA